MRKGVSIMFFSLLLLSCSSDNEEKDALKSKISSQKDAVAFLSNQDALIAFGAIQMDLLLKKIITDSKLGASGLIPRNMIDDYIDCIDTKSPIYYAVRDSKQSNGIPDIIVFGKIIDADALINTIKLDAPFLKLEKEGEVQYLVEGELKLGINDQYFVALINGQESKKNSKRKLNTILKELNGKGQNKVIDDVLSNAKDFTFAFNSAELSKFSAETIGTPILQINDKLNTLVAMHLSFEKGAIKIVAESHPSEEIESWNLFKKDSKPLLPTLGSGSPVGAFAINMNVDEYERLQKAYFPLGMANSIQESGLEKELLNYIPDNLAVIEALIKKEGITSFINGEFGAAIYADDGIHSEYSLHLGIGPSLRPMLADELDYYKNIFYKFDLDDKKLAIYSSENNGPQSQETPLTIPKQFSSFGTYPMSGFMDLERIPSDDMIPDYAEPFMELLSNCIFNASMKEGSIVLNMKNKEINSLTQICNQIPKLIMGSILQ